MPRDAQEPGLAVPGPVLATGCGAGPGALWLHASCVELAGSGIVLIGPSGSGKSDLALRLIDGGARLIADDQLTIERVGRQLFGRPAAGLAGLLEVRGFGIVRLRHGARSRLELVVDLDPRQAAERLPEPAVHPLLGVDLPCLHLDSRAPSACAKVRLALAAERVA